MNDLNSMYANYTQFAHKNNCSLYDYKIDLMHLTMSIDDNDDNDHDNINNIK